MNQLNSRANRRSDEESARHEYARTHGGKQPEKFLRLRVECAAGAPLVVLGPALAVEYGPTDKGLGMSVYRHVFEGGRAPTLAVNARTSKLHFVGGQYDLTPEGVEDLPVERGGARRPVNEGESDAMAEAMRAYEGLHGAAPEHVEAVAIQGCEVRALAALGPLVAVEWHEAGGGPTRRHEFRGTDAHLAFDTERKFLHVVGDAYTVSFDTGNDLSGDARMMYDDPYAIVANPDLFGSPHMRQNPGVLLTREELPTEQHAPHIVVAGTLIATLAGIAAVAAVEYLPMIMPGMVNTPEGLAVLRLMGVAGGVGVAFKFPVIGSAIAGGCGWKFVEGLLDSKQWAPVQLRGAFYVAPAADAPASSHGLDAGGVFTPFPTGAVRVAG